MRIRDFELEILPRDAKRRLRLDIAAREDGGAWRLPLLTTVGAQDGPTLLVLAGAHGEEFEGIAAMPQVYRAIASQNLRGRLLMAPICNMPASEAARHLSRYGDGHSVAVYRSARRRWLRS